MQCQMCAPRRTSAVQLAVVVCIACRLYGVAELAAQSVTGIISAQEFLERVGKASKLRGFDFQRSSEGALLFYCLSPDETVRTLAEERGIKAPLAQQTGEWRQDERRLVMSVACCESGGQARKLVQEINSWKGSVHSLLAPGSLSGCPLGDCCWEFHDKHRADLAVAVGNLAFYFQLVAQGVDLDAQRLEDVARLQVTAIAGRTRPSILVPRIRDIRLSQEEVDKGDECRITILAEDPTNSGMTYVWGADVAGRSFSSDNWSSQAGDTISYRPKTEGVHHVRIAVLSAEGFMSWRSVTVEVRSTAPELARLRSALIKKLDDPKTREADRRKALSQLREVADKSCVPVLLKHAHGRHGVVSGQQAIELLGAIRDPRAVPELVRLLREPPRRKPTDEEDADDRILRREAVDALEQIGDTAALPVLEALAKDKKEYPSVREYAVGAIGELGDESVLPTLQTIANSEDEAKDLRQEAQNMIESIKERKAEETEKQDR